MSNMAKWGPMAFVCSASKLVPLMDLKVTMAAKVESQDDASGTSQSVIKGKEPEIIGLATRYVRGAGVDPLAKVNEWRALIGKAYPLYINGKRFGPANMLLKNAEASEILTDNAGRFLSLKMTITLEEKQASVKTTKKAKKEETETQSSVDVSNALNAGSVPKESKTAAAAALKKNARKVNKHTVTSYTDTGTGKKNTVSNLKGSGTKEDPYVYNKSVETIFYRGATCEVLSWVRMPALFGKYYPVIMFNGKKQLVYEPAYAKNTK